MISKSKFQGWVVAVLLGLWAIAFVLQPRYIAYHRPLIRSGVAAAEKEGLDLYKKAGVPPGATACSVATMTPAVDEDGESIWAGVQTGVFWTGVWDAPGDHAAIVAWYRDHLLADGWKVFHEEPPRSVENEFWKDKWLLTIEAEANFATDHPPHTRFRLRLEWDYWHKLDAARW